MGSLAWHDLGGLIRQFKLTCFAETGTHWGGGMDYALDAGFKKAFSIDANPRHVQKAQALISAKYPGRTFMIECLPSPEGVSWLLSKIDGPTLWWLDAHFPKLYQGPGDVAELPLMQEVSRIVAAKRARDVILSDDMQVWFDTSVPYDNAPGTRKGDPGEVVVAMRMLEATHHTYLSREGGGFLLALPRG